jgi:hypothetical protein
MRHQGDPLGKVFSCVLEYRTNIRFPLFIWFLPRTLVNVVSPVPRLTNF